MKKVFDCWYEDPAGRLGRAQVYADNTLHAIEVAREYFRDYCYLGSLISTVTAQEIDMNADIKRKDIANQEEWEREADEEAWAAQAAEATARRQKSNG